MALVDPEELVGFTFDMPDDEGNIQEMTIVEAVEDHQKKIFDSSAHRKFRVSRNQDQCEEIMAYNDIIDHIEKQGEAPIFWELDHIVSHEGPLTKEHPSYKGSTFNVRVEWSNGEITDEPLSIIAADAPVACAIYAKKKGLLNQPGWKRFKRIAKRHGKYFVEANKAKVRAHFTKPKYKYGIELPKNYADAVCLDTQNGNTLWQEAIKLEMAMMDKYNVFKDDGKGASIP